MSKPSNTQWYQFRQNNSGGAFKAPAIYVHIEASSRDDANERATQFGLYFNGCESGKDCSCCGDRWSPTYEEGTDVPSLYGRPLTAEQADGAISWGAAENLPEHRLCYLDGRVEDYNETFTTYKKKPRNKRKE